MQPSLPAEATDGLEHHSRERGGLMTGFNAAVALAGGAVLLHGLSAGQFLSGRFRKQARVSEHLSSCWVRAACADQNPPVTAHNHRTGGVAALICMRRRSSFRAGGRFYEKKEQGHNRSQ